MGGTIAMIIRKPKDRLDQDTEPEVQPMLRWTNIMPHSFSRESFLEGDFDRWWPDFSKSWRDMREDYEANKGTGRYKHNMTGAYFPCERLAPDGYGLVVVDFQTKTLLHAQGYTSLGQENLHHMRSYESEDLANLRRLHEGGWIPTLRLTSFNLELPEYDAEGQRVNRVVEVDVPIQRLGHAGLDKLREMLESAHLGRSGRTVASVLKQLGVPVPEGVDPKLETRIDMACLPFKTGDALWSFEHFDESAAGFAQLRKRAGELGLSFSQEDDLAWHQRILECLELDDISHLSKDELDELKQEIGAEIDASLHMLGWTVEGACGPAHKQGKQSVQGVQPPQKLDGESAAPSDLSPRRPGPR